MHKDYFAPFQSNQESCLIAGSALGYHHMEMTSRSYKIIAGIYKFLCQMGLCTYM
jgi:hypothetical protein